MKSVSFILSHYIHAGCPWARGAVKLAATTKYLWTCSITGSQGRCGKHRNVLDCSLPIPFLTAVSCWAINSRSAFGPFRKHTLPLVWITRKGAGHGQVKRSSRSKTFLKRRDFPNRNQLQGQLRLLDFETRPLLTPYPRDLLWQEEGGGCRAEDELRSR